MIDPLPPQRPRFPIIGVMGMANGTVWALYLTAAYVVQQWRLGPPAPG